MKWVDAVAPELSAPDLWSLAAQQAKRIETDPGAANTQFTLAEQAEIADGLLQLEEFVYQSEPSLPLEKREAVSARFQYLRRAAERLGRMDWMAMVIGQFFSMTAEKIITVQTFQSLYNMAAGVFSRFLDVGGAIVKSLGG